MRQTKQEIKLLAVEETVRSYFLHYPLETFNGLVRANEVVEDVRLQFSVLGLKFTEKDETETYNIITELGPCGEDMDWLRDWGPNQWSLLLVYKRTGQSLFDGLKSLEGGEYEQR